MLHINQNELINTLKNLSEDQCLAIAKIIKNDVVFCLFESPNKWDGHDLVSKREHCSNGLFKYIIQIDYRDAPFSTVNERFRFYEDLYEYHVSSIEAKSIIEYLTTINPLIQQ